MKQLARLQSPALLPFASIFLLLLLGSIGQADPKVSAASGSDLQKSASWNWPDVANYEALLLSYLDQQGADQALRQQVEEYWKQTEAVERGPAFMDRLLDAASLIDPRVRELTRQLRATDGPLVPPGELSWLTSDVPGWLQDTIRLAYGRAFAQRRLVDEALESLTGLGLSQVCDPSSLLFYRASSQHLLLNKDECLSNVRLLLEREAELPTRYAQVAQLIEADIKPLETDSLDEVSRLMNDVQRRLDLGRAGQRVRTEEQDIVDKLDKLIKKIEEQMQQQQAQQQAQQNGGAPQQGQLQPMEDSQVAGGSGAGDVDNKEAGDRAGWGNLPPAERQQALQRLTEELPSHYRDVIEGYFRQLAKDRSK